MEKYSLELVRAILTSKYSNAIMSGSNTHEPTLKMVCEGLPYRQDIPFYEGVFDSCAPENYSGNTRQEIRGMVDDGIAKGLHLRNRGTSGPSGDGKKQSEIIVEAVYDAGAEFFNSPLGQSFMSVPGAKGGREHVPLDSMAASDFLQKSYRKKTEKIATSAAIKEARDSLRSTARFDCSTHPTFIRVAGHEGKVYVDMGDETNAAVEISQRGWQIVDEPPVRFVRPAGTLSALPIPESGFDPEELRSLLGLSMPNYILMVAFTINVLNPEGPFFILQIQGEQGTGKSTLARMVKNMIDPNVADKLRLAKDERNLAIQAQGQWVLNYDNLSYISSDMSDMICTVATGGAISTRTLYTNSDQTTLVFKRPVILNGIGNFATRPDLMERSIPLYLRAIDLGDRKTDREMRTALDRIWPKFLGYIFDCLSFALANLDEVEPPRSIRMADAAHWLVAAEPATGFPEGAILDALEIVQRDLIVQNAVNDTLTVALMELLLKQSDHSFTGRFGQLHDLLLGASERHGKGLPASPSALSSKIERMKPGMRKIGLIAEDGQRTSSGQSIVMSLNEEGIKLAQEIVGGRDAKPYL